MISRHLKKTLSYLKASTALIAGNTISRVLDQCTVFHAQFDEVESLPFAVNATGRLVLSK